MAFDFSILEFIQANLRSGFRDACMSFITHLGDGGAVWIVLAALLLLFPKTRRAGAVVMLAIALEVICCNFILKPFVARPRPFEMNPAVELLIARPADFSFPSGHTGAFFAAAAGIVKLGEKKLHSNPVCLSKIEERKNK